MQWLARQGEHRESATAYAGAIHPRQPPGGAQPAPHRVHRRRGGARDHGGARARRVGRAQRGRAPVQDGPVARARGRGERAARRRSGAEHAARRRERTRRADEPGYRRAAHRAVGLAAGRPVRDAHRAGRAARAEPRRALRAAGRPRRRRARGRPSRPHRRGAADRPRDSEGAGGQLRRRAGLRRRGEPRRPLRRDGELRRRRPGVGLARAPARRDAARRREGAGGVQSGRAHARGRVDVVGLAPRPHPAAAGRRVRRVRRVRSVGALRRRLGGDGGDERVGRPDRRDRRRARRAGARQRHDEHRLQPGWPRDRARHAAGTRRGVGLACAPAARHAAPRGRDARAIFGADGKTLYVGATDGKIRVLDWASGDVLAELRGHRGAVAGVALARGRADRVVGRGPDDPALERLQARRDAPGAVRRWTSRASTSRPTAASR